MGTVLELAWHSNGMGTDTLKDSNGNEYGSVSLCVTGWVAKVKGCETERFMRREDARLGVERMVMREIEKVFTG